jgi:hypothetical protein
MIAAIYAFVLTLVLALAILGRHHHFTTSPTAAQFSSCSSTTAYPSAPEYP